MITPLQGDVTPSEFNTYKAETKTPIVVFTYDDGYPENVLTNTILTENSLVGCYGLITDSIYTAGRNDLANFKDYERLGSEILSHSSTHISMKTTDAVVTPEVLDYEYRYSAQKLRNLGFNVKGLVVPFSSARQEYYDFAKDYYDYILIGGTGLNGKNDFKDKLLTRVSTSVSGIDGCKGLIDQAIAENKLLIFYDHRTGYEGSMTEADTREVMSYAKAKIDAGLIKNMNMMDAITYYYYTPTTTYKKRNNLTDNYAPYAGSNAYVVENPDGLGAYIGLDTSVGIAQKITIPIASTGSAILATTLVLPTTFSELGEFVDFNFSLACTSSQFDRIGTKAMVTFLDAVDVVLWTEEHILQVRNALNYYNFSSFVPSGVIVDNVKKIKISFVFTINTATTAAVGFRLSKFNILFPNSGPKSTAPIKTVKTILNGDVLYSADLDNVLFINSGASLSTVRLPLTTTCIGKETTWIVGHADGLRVLPQATEQIRGSNAINNYIGSVVVGDTITFICVVAGWWEVKSKNGSWTYQV